MGKVFAFIQTIFQKLKNLDQLLADLFKWLTSLGLDAKAAVVLEQGVSFNMDVLFGLFTTIKKATKKRWIKQLKKIGFSYKTEDEIITFVHKEQEIFKGTLQEAETELASYFKNAKKERKSLEKYLDEVAEVIIRFLITEHFVDRQYSIIQKKLYPTIGTN